MQHSNSHAASSHLLQPKEAICALHMHLAEKRTCIHLPELKSYWTVLIKECPFVALNPGLSTNTCINLCVILFLTVPHDLFLNNQDLLASQQLQRSWN